MLIHISACSDRLMSHFFREEKKGSTAFFQVSRSSIYFGPDNKYAVIRITGKGLFVAVKTVEETAEELRCIYIDHYTYFTDEPMLQKLWVDWACARYGFCKLILWAPELVNEFGGFFETTLHRFYFDRELYEKKREELHGTIE